MGALPCTTSRTSRLDLQRSVLSSGILGPKKCHEVGKEFKKPPVAVGAFIHHLKIDPSDDVPTSSEFWRRARCRAGETTFSGCEAHKRGPSLAGRPPYTSHPCMT